MSNFPVTKYMIDESRILKQKIGIYSSLVFNQTGMVFQIEQLFFVHFEKNSGTGQRKQ